MAEFQPSNLNRPSEFRPIRMAKKHFSHRIHLIHRNLIARIYTNDENGIMEEKRCIVYLHIVAFALSMERCVA